MFIVSRALSTSSPDSLSLSLALKLSTRSLMGDSGGKLNWASSFELGGSSLLHGPFSTPISEFKLTGFKTVSVSYKFRGKVLASSYDEGGFS